MVVVAVDSASDAAAAVIAVAVVAGMPVADDDCDCDYDCGSAVFSGSRIVAYKDRVLVGPVPIRFLPVEVRSAGYGLLSQGRAVVEVACYDSFERTHGSSTYVASASGVRPSQNRRIPFTNEFVMDLGLIRDELVLSARLLFLYAVLLIVFVNWNLGIAAKIRTGSSKILIRTVVLFSKLDSRYKYEW